MPAGAFYAFKLWWIFPICFMVWAIHKMNYMQGIIVLLLLGGAFCLAFIGYDFTRMITIAFPAVLLSYEWAREKFDRKILMKFSAILIVLNFLILQYHFNYDGPQPMFPWILNKASAYFGTSLN